MSEQDIKEKTFDLLNVIIGCDILTVFNDKLVGTQSYRHKLKQHSKGLNEEMEKVLDSNLKKMFKVDEEIYQNISINKEQLIQTLSKKVMTMRPENFLELNQILNLYFDNKLEFQKNFEITMKSINDK